MNDEIKEILDKLEIVARKHTIEVCDDGSKIETMPASIVDELRLNNWSAKLLLDYITNLQQEKERLKQELNCKRYFSSTMPENTEFVILTKNNYDRQQKDIQLELVDYKSRCEKAIEYIMSELVDEWSIKNDGHVHGSDLPVDAITPILDILNGRSE